MKHASYEVRTRFAFLSLFCAVLVLSPLLAQPPGDTPAAGSNGEAISSSSELDAERAKIWDSQGMLEARAYLETYFKRSARITPEQAEKYMADLKAKSPEEMQIWLIQFQEEREQRRQEFNRGRQLQQQAALGQLPAQRMGAFRNPLAGRQTPPTGLPASGVQPTVGGGTNVFATRPPTQKPFSSPEYARSVRPLVTSEDVARYEILRGLGPGFIY
jgi:hypothetical protein